MKKMKVDIAGVVALNWLVAQIEDMQEKFEQGGVWYMDEACTVPYAPASNPLHGDAIIDRERISTLARNFYDNPDWWATTNPYVGQDDDDDIGCAGETRLIAAMRAFVAKYRGRVAEVPDEIADDAGNGIRVRRVGSSEEWETWNLIANLTDRWGEINHHDAENKPLEELQSDPERLERLRAQMWDEISFIVQKDGQFGILFEVEFCSKESEEGLRDVTDYNEHTVVVEALMKGMSKMAEQFPQVLFAVPDEAHVFKGRPAAWAYAEDGMLDQKQREEIGMALLSL